MHALTLAKEKNDDYSDDQFHNDNGFFASFFERLLEPWTVSRSSSQTHSRQRMARTARRMAGADRGLWVGNQGEHYYDDINDYDDEGDEGDDDDDGGGGDEYDNFVERGIDFDAEFGLEHASQQRHFDNVPAPDSLFVDIRQLERAPGPYVHNVSSAHYCLRIASGKPLSLTLRDILRDSDDEPSSLVLLGLHCQFKADTTSTSTNNLESVLSQHSVQMTVTGLNGFLELTQQLGYDASCGIQRRTKTAACLFSSCVETETVCQWAHLLDADLDAYVAVGNEDQREQADVSVEMDAGGWLAHGLYMFEAEHKASKSTACDKSYNHWTLSRADCFPPDGINAGVMTTDALTTLQAPLHTWHQFHTKLKSVLSNMCVVENLDRCNLVVHFLGENGVVLNPLDLHIFVQYVALETTRLGDTLKGPREVPLSRWKYHRQEQRQHRQNLQTQQERLNALTSTNREPPSIARPLTMNMSLETTPDLKANLPSVDNNSMVLLDIGDEHGIKVD